MQRNIFNTLMMVMGFLIVTAFTQVANAASSCDVTKLGNNGADDAPLTGSFAQALWEHAQPNGLCREEIVLKSDVYIVDQLAIDNNHNTSLVIKGDTAEGAEKRKLYAKTTLNGDAVFDITNASNVTIENVALWNYAQSSQPQELTTPTSTILKCNSSDGLILKDVEIKNNPDTELLFENCSDLTIENLVIDAQSTSVYPAADENYHTTPYIRILNGDNIHIVSLTINTGSKAIDRDAIVIDGASNVSIDSLIVESADNENATVLSLNNITTLSTLNVDMSQVAGTAVKLNNVVNSSQKSYTLSKIGGTYSGAATVSGGASEYTSSIGDGVVIAGNSKNMKFQLSGAITDFKRSGIVVEGTAQNIQISGNQVTGNGGFGVVVGSTATNVSITSMLTKDNGNCGVAIASAQIVSGVNYVNNGNSCSLGVPDSLKLSESDVILIATDDKVATLDVDTSVKTDGRSAKLELHHYYASTATATSSGSTRPRDTARKPGEFNFSNIMVKPFTGMFAQTTATATSTTGVEPMNGANASTSIIEASIDIATSLPNSNITLETANDTFMVVAKQADGTVTGVWYGDASSTGEGECLYEFSNGECGCIQGATTTDYIRVYKISIDGEPVDTDGDGLLDNEELGGLGGPGSTICAEDSCTDPNYKGKECTSPVLSDTDNDEMTDFNEINYGTDPLDEDSDSDGMNDGKEDSCATGQAGFYDASCETDAMNPDTDGDGLTDGEEVNGDGEYDPLFDTNPMVADTDGDGILDKVDEHPLCNDNTSSCTYSDCRDLEAINEAVDGSFSISDFEPNQTADDDGDGIPNGIEDSGVSMDFNYNCTYDPTNSETDPLVADTDGDGCDDGQEDRNYNGVVDAGETDPRDADTDGDLIPDGTEVAGCLYVAGSTNDSNPLSTDTDGDGINDGIEDINYNGVVDAGETNPALADSDNDGLYDTAWPVDVIINEDGSVEPAEAGRDLSPNYADSSNAIVNYYCGVSNYDYIDTDGDTIPDVQETPSCRLNPANISTANSLNPDTDMDGLPDDLEFCYGTSPWAADTEGDGISDYDEFSAKGRISITTMRATCADGPLESEGATDGTTTTTSCSLNSNLFATSAGHYPITVMVLMFAGVLGLRSRKASQI